MDDQDTPPPAITAMKIPIIKKGEYNIWSIRMRQYICHIDHNLWDIIVNRDLKDEATPSGEQSSPLVPKTTKQLAARRNQERIKSILLLAIPDRNGVTEKKNRTLIEAARTMLADSLLPIPFWAEAVNTACYVLNRVLVTKPQNKTPYALLIGKFDGKSDEGTGPNWMFDLDFLTNSMNYISVSVENQVIVDASTQDSYVAVRTLANGTQQLVASIDSKEYNITEASVRSKLQLADATGIHNLSDAAIYAGLATLGPFVSTDRSFVSTDRSNTPNVSAASTSTGANADKSSFVYPGGKIPIDASTHPNADFPIDPNMHDWKFFLILPN
ncbi:putative ribonuclease H-like domain-containing protein [Tanacetum coccineum]